jgi:hypothetical protein
MDTVSIFTAGVKRYIFTGLDISTRFAFAHTYKSNSSANGKDFLEKFIRVAPFTIRNIQTDNGSEFSEHFAQYCEEKRLIHFYNYPKHPQSNGHLERFNRTVQEQFAEWHIDELDEPEVFNRPLMDYLIWYNTEKPHRGIGKVAPLRYYLDNFITLPEKSNMLWTLTPYILNQIKVLPTSSLLPQNYGYRVTLTSVLPGGANHGGQRVSIAYPSSRLSALTMLQGSDHSKRLQAPFAWLG